MKDEQTKMPDKDYEIAPPSGARIMVSIKMIGGRVGLLRHQAGCHVRRKRL